MLTNKGRTGYWDSGAPAIGTKGSYQRAALLRFAGRRDPQKRSGQGPR